MRAPDVGQFIANIEGSSLQCFWYGAAPMSVARLEEALELHNEAMTFPERVADPDNPVGLYHSLRMRGSCQRILKTEFKGRQS